MAGASNCSACSKPLPRDGRVMRCASCSLVSHIGKVCSGIADSTFTSMGETKRGAWLCRSCRSAGRSQPGTPASPKIPEGDNAMPASNLSSILEELKLMKASMDSLRQLPTKVDALLALRPVVEAVRETMMGVQESMDFLSAKYDALLAAVAANDQAVHEVQAEVSDLRGHVHEQAKEIQALKEELNASEQYSRLPNLEIHGLPHLPREDLGVGIVDLARRVGILDFHPSEVAAVHRLPGKKNEAPPVLVRFQSVTGKKKWMAVRARLHELSQDGSMPRLYFNDNLTRINKELFWMARSRARESHFKFVWVRDGSIFAKKDETSRVIRITRHTDIEKIV
ncbi:unnamed protein product [Ixodes hexagonus]